MSDPTAPADEDPSRDGRGADDDTGVRVWLVERTYSDDEQNLIILTYATPDGARYYRMERALTGVADARETAAAKRVDPSDLGDVADPETREWYATEVARMAEKHSPEDAI